MRFESLCSQVEVTQDERAETDTPAAIVAGFDADVLADQTLTEEHAVGVPRELAHRVNATHVDARGILERGETRWVRAR